MLDSNFSFDLPRAVTYFHSHFFKNYICFNYFHVIFFFLVALSGNKWSSAVEPRDKKRCLIKGESKATYMNIFET